MKDSGQMENMERTEKYRRVCKQEVNICIVLGQPLLASGQALLHNNIVSHITNSSEGLSSYNDHDSFLLKKRLCTHNVSVAAQLKHELTVTKLLFLLYQPIQGTFVHPKQTVHPKMKMAVSFNVFT